MQKYEPIGLKTMDGKEIMTYTKEYYFTYVKPRLEKASEIYERMLIESSKGKEELYQNIEDVIDNQENLDGDKEENNQQLETLIKYELTGTENENIIKNFIEKIKNGKGDEANMTNASRIINREMRAREKAAKNEGMLLGISQGISKGIAMMAKKLKDKMSIEEICQLTGLSEQQIENL